MPVFLVVLYFIVEHPIATAIIVILLISAGIAYGVYKKREAQAALERYEAEQEERRWQKEEAERRRHLQRESERQKREQEKQRIADEKRRAYQNAERIRKAEQKRKQKEAEAARAAKEAQMTEQRRYIAQQRRLVNDGVRYDVMMRDGFRCVLCGATQADGVKLHVDHIIPLSKGGTSEMSNLRTLCERCNIGKSDKLEVVPLQQNSQRTEEKAPLALSLDEFAAIVAFNSNNEYNSFDDLLQMLSSKGIPFVDKRASGGCIWAKSSKEYDDFLSSVRVSGVGFEYAKSTRNFNGNPGWFIK